MSIFLRHQHIEGCTPFESPVSVAFDNDVTPSARAYNSRTGFTLIETLVAVTILLIVIIGPMTIAQKGIQNAYYAREQLVAVSLAQEAVEGIRELRDTRALEVYGGASGPTNSWIPTTCAEGNCAYLGGNVGQCYGEDCRLKYNAETNTYTHDVGGGGSSIYIRRVTIGTSVGGGVPVSADVAWKGKIFGGADRHIVLQTWIYDHYRRYD